MEKEQKHIVEDGGKSPIDLFLLWRVLQGNFLKVLIVAVILGAALGVYRYTNSSPYYSVDVVFITKGVAGGYTEVTDENGNIIKDYVVVPYGNGLQSESLAAAYADKATGVIPSDRSVRNVIDQLALNHPGKYNAYGRNAIRAMLTDVEVEGQIIRVKVSSSSRAAVLDVAVALTETLPKTMDYFCGIESTLLDDETENRDSVVNVLEGPADELIRETGRNVPRYIAIGFIAGAAIVYLLCLFRTYFDNTIYSEEDLKHRFTIPVVGQIPTWENTNVGDKTFKDKSKKERVKAKKKSKTADNGNLMSDRDYTGRLLDKKTPFAITEAFKTLRTNLCYTTKGEKCPVYGMTSAYVSAGKSLIISNTAISFSQMDNKKVLLIDADLRCPVQHKIFNLDNKVHGLSDLLAGICEFDDLYLRNGGYPNLDIITSGKIPPNPAELLASDNMKNFIEMVRTRYDVVLIDLPPVCEVSDAGVISDLVTGFAFVVRAGYSDRRMIELAVETMEGFDASFVGFILNDIDIKSGDYYKNKYYSSYSKYRFRYGKGGYYRSHKYAYGKNYYSNAHTYGQGYNRGYSNYSTSYGSNYSHAHDNLAADDDMNVETQRNPLPDGTKRKAGDNK